MSLEKKLSPFFDTDEPEDEQEQPRRRNWLKIVLAALSLLFVVVILGIGVLNVIKNTPQEKLAKTYVKTGDKGAFPLRAMLVFENKSTHPLLDQNDAQQEYKWCRTFDWDAQKTLECSTARLGAKKEVQCQKALFSNTKEPIYVLMLHGIKCSGEIWLAVINQWLSARSASSSEEIIFILPDLLGHGRSSWPEATYTVQLHVDALKRLLQSMLFTHVPQCAADRKPRLHIVGHSLGAMLALELSTALLQQDSNISVASLTLMATPYFTDRSQAESSASNHSFWFRNQWLATTCCGYLVCRQNWLWQRALRRKFAREFPQLPHAALVGGLSHTHHGIKSSIESVVLDHRADAAVQQICVAKIPTLLIDSDGDKLCIESQRQLRAIFSNLASKYTYAVTLKGAKHGFIVHNYAEVTDHLQAFIETLVKTTLF